MSTAQTASAFFLALLAAISLTGCGWFMGIAGYPPEPMRKTPPPGIENALKVGAAAPDFELASTTGKTVSLEKVLADRSAVVVFYRVDW